MSTQSPADDDQEFNCLRHVPITAELLTALPPEGILLSVILFCFSMTTLGIYVEEIFFVVKHFSNKIKILWLLACYPIYSFTSLLAIIAPKSSTIMDVLAHGYFATCMFVFSLLINENMELELEKILKSNNFVKTSALPCCCVGLCLRKIPLTRGSYNWIQKIVLQVAIVRPLLAILSLVLWANGNYRSGEFSVRNTQMYIFFMQIASTMLAMYGLMMQKDALQSDRANEIKLNGKMKAVQLTLISPILIKIILNVLVASNVLTCSPLFPAPARGEAIYNGIVILIMLPLCLVARIFFRKNLASNNEKTFRKMNSIEKNNPLTQSRVIWLAISETDV